MNDVCGPRCEIDGGLVLALLWISVAVLLTFRAPFPYTGNGFFACWFGVLQSVQVLYRELFSASYYRKVLPQ